MDIDRHSVGDPRGRWRRGKKRRELVSYYYYSEAMLPEELHYTL